MTTKQRDDDRQAPVRSDVEHQQHNSSLIRRTPSREVDDARLSGIHNSHTAANIRTVVGLDKVDELHEPIVFSWRQFWTTLLYETLPPVIFSPLAALLIEPSREAAWHVIQHRGLLATSTRYRPLPSVLVFCLMQYPMVYLIHIALAVALFGPADSLIMVDPWQITLAYGFNFVRNLIISVKYGYLRPEDTAQLRRSPPHWDEDRTDRRLIFGGWRSPGNYPGLIEDELTCAMDENNIALQAMSFRIDEDSSATLREHPTNELFTAATPNNANNEVSAGFVAHQLLRRAYSVPFPKHYGAVVMLTPLLLIAIPPLTRWHRGLHLLGDTGLETLVGTAVLLGCFFGSVPVFVFGLISAHDFNRRARLISSLGSLVTYPGIPLSKLLGNTSEATQKTAPEAHLFISLKNANNVFAWMNCRKTLRSFGEGYYQRTQVYTSILLGYAFLCVFALNIIMWGQLQHHVSTVYLISFLVFAIASIAIASINKATRLQGLSRIHRDMIKQEVFLQEKQLLELDPASQQVDIQRLRQAKTLLQQVDEMIHFQEEIYKPTRVLGQAATQNVLNSTFGLLLAGVVFAVEGSGGARIVYDTFGWFMK